MCYVRSFEEAVYEWKQRELFAPLPVRNAHPERHEDCAPECPFIRLVLCDALLTNFGFAVRMSIGREMYISEYVAKFCLLASEF